MSEQAMSERTVRTETLRAATPISVGGVTLVPIERTLIRAQLSRGCAWFSVARQPHALIVRDADGLRVLSTVVDAGAVHADAAAAGGGSSASGRAASAPGAGTTGTRAVSLDALRAAIPGLDALLASM